MKKKIIIISLIILIVLVSITTSFYFSLSNSFKINGKKTVTITYNKEYEEKGASAKVFNKDISKKIKIKSNVDTKKVGKYKVKYKLNYFIFYFEKTRTVIVRDNISPKIELKGSDTKVVCPNTDYVEEGYTAFDNYDGDITNKVVIQKKEDKIVYEVKDTSSNSVKVFRNIKYEDKVIPTLKLKGSSSVGVKLNSNYTDSGYIVSDNCDKDVVVTSNNNINTKKVGKYVITYTAKDKSGNKATISRIVNVYDPSVVGYIYLTFDDGPSSSGSTKKILDVLNKKGVKATFFVVGSGDDNLIRREFNEGHAIALHTNSHNYASVYSSVDNYFADLNRISDKVYNITKVRTKIIRFPGGSNNTVSNRYSRGIMNTLKNKVLEQGYIYYDWNISAGDAGGCTSSDCVYNNVVPYLSKSRNNIVLMHDTKWATANAIERIIDYGLSNGYVFKTIDASVPPVRFK